MAVKKCSEKQVAFFNGLYDEYYKGIMPELHDGGLTEYKHDNPRFELVMEVKEMLAGGKLPSMKKMSQAIGIMREYLY